jgi:hypothetical protein
METAKAQNWPVEPQGGKNNIVESALKSFVSSGRRQFCDVLFHAGYTISGEGLFFFSEKEFYVL